ncbi:hypothetical protein [Kurthia senegalensis]|uniref:hypothetical protein n=1 Tax=Kurthia senegalensis TaxID=1033740 RepID=UPI000289CED8|nr:hypothetical protein [Kurthia senegalensis]
MIIWPFFIGMIAGFIALHVTILFQKKHYSILKQRLPAIILIVLGVVLMMVGFNNYTFTGKSAAYFGLAALFFGVIAISLLRKQNRLFLP